MINQNELEKGNVRSLTPVYYQLHAITNGNPRWNNNEGFGIYATPHIDQGNVVRLLSKDDEAKALEDPDYMKGKDFLGKAIVQASPPKPENS